MKQKLTKFFNLIKDNKSTKLLVISSILLLFIFTLGYSLSVFTGTKIDKLANIKINDLSFNITTNGGTSNDRILHLQSNKIESFSVIITNLNKINAKYELIYDVCSDSKCSSLLDSLPSGVKVEFMTENSDELNGLINNNNETKKINLLTTNNTSSDVYIRINLNAGYEWNDLELADQIKEYSKVIDIIAYVDGVEVNDYPSTCSYKVTVKAYKSNQEITLNNLSVTCDTSTNLWKTSYTGFADKIEINFIPLLNIAKFLLNLDKTENGLEVDNTADANLRYVGTSPKNYIKFNDETWRIIGVFNNVTSIDENGNEKNESLVKIIRNESLGDYSWDTSASDVNSGWGVNDWSQADLMNELNGDYLDTSKTGTTNWYNGKSNEITGAYDYSNSIKDSYQGMIANVKWNLGGYSTDSVSAKNMYSYERGTTTYQNSGVTAWNGKIALMYPSDYGYASTNTSCRSILNTPYDCKNENWLYNSNSQWTLSQISSYAYYVFLASSSGRVYGYNFPFTAYGVRPAIYLESNIQITSGSGEANDPYILG